MQALVDHRVPMDALLKHVRKMYAMAALDIERGNACRASVRIGMHRNSLRHIVGRRKERHAGN